MESVQNVATIVIKTKSDSVCEKELLTFIKVME